MGKSEKIDRKDLAILQADILAWGDGAWKSFREGSLRQRREDDVAEAVRICTKGA